MSKKNEDFKSVPVLPWDKSVLDAKGKTLQINAAFKDNLLDHMFCLDSEAEIGHQPLSKIVCTIGPASRSQEELESLMEAGMSVALLESGSMSSDELLQTVRNIREAVHTYSTRINRVFPLAVALEIIGPTIYTGRLLEGGSIDIEEGATIILTPDPVWQDKGTVEKIFVDFPKIMEFVSEGSDIIIDYGKIILNVTYVSEDDNIQCKVIRGGLLHENRNLQLVGVAFPSSQLTEKDKHDIEMAMHLSLDFIFVPFVRTASVLEEIRSISERRNTNILLVAKLQSKLINENIESIVREADAIVVVRDALTVEISGERIFITMDNMCSICKMLGKPCLVEGAIMPSMMSKNSPDLLEIQDVVMCQRKGFGGFILKDVTAYGKNSKRCVEELFTILSQAEPSYWQSHFFQKLVSLATLPVDPAHALAMSVVETSSRTAASAIIIVTTSGSSVKLVCQYLPRVPVIAVTGHSRVARELALWKAVIPYHYVAPSVKDWHTNMDLRIQAGIELGKVRRIISPGDPIVLLNNSRPGAGFTNTMRVYYASQADPWANVTSVVAKNPADDKEVPCPDVIQQCPYLQEKENIEEGERLRKKSEEGECLRKKSEEGERLRKSSEEGKRPKKSSEEGECPRKSSEEGERLRKSSEQGERLIKSSEEGERLRKSSEQGERLIKSSEEGDLF